MKSNPSQFVSIADAICDEKIPDTLVSLEEYYPQSVDDPKEIESEGDLYPLRNFIVVGTKGKMLRVYAEQAIPIEGNIFDWDKLCAVANSPCYYDFKIPFISSLIDPFYMSLNTLEEALEYQVDGGCYIEFAEFDEDDEDEVFIQVRDGNHRLFGMLLSGEPYVYAHITTNRYQEYQEWVSVGKPEDYPNHDLLVYLDENLL